MNPVKRAFSKLTCPSCGGTLKRLHIGKVESPFGGTLVEALYWILVGSTLAVLEIFISDMLIFGLWVVVMLILAYVVDRLLSSYRCEACEREYTYREAVKTD